MSLARRTGLAAGPLLALACHLWLPVRYADAGGAAVEFSLAGRATLGMMAWMATQVATMLPILSALAPALGVPAPLLLVPCTFGASPAFMMPVGAPPNAIVFGTGLVPMQRMLRAGFWLNLAGIAVITALAWLWFGPMPGASG